MAIKEEWLYTSNGCQNEGSEIEDDVNTDQGLQKTFTITVIEQNLLGFKVPLKSRNEQLWGI